MTDTEEFNNDFPCSLGINVMFPGPTGFLLARLCKVTSGLGDRPGIRAITIRRKTLTIVTDKRLLGPAEIAMVNAAIVQFDREIEACDKLGEAESRECMVHADMLSRLAMEASEDVRTTPGTAANIVREASAVLRRAAQKIAHLASIVSRS